MQTETGQRQLGVCDMELKPGDKVYAACIGYDEGVLVESATVEKVTAKRVVLEPRTGLAFRCRRIFDMEGHEVHTSPADAVKALRLSVASDLKLSEERVQEERNVIALIDSYLESMDDAD